MIESILSSLPYVLPALILGFALGFVIARSMLTAAAKSSSSGIKLNDDKTKLDNEILSDQVTQLEAKIKTLEKALEMNT